MIISAVAGLILTMAAAATPQTYVLDLQENVHDVTARDITGNGVAELLVLCCDEKSRPLTKYMAVFEAAADGSYSSAPTAFLSLGASISTIFFSNYNGSPGVNVVAADAEGAIVYGYKDGQFTPVASPRFSSLLPSGAKVPKFYQNIAVDIDGSGVEEWVIPVPGGYEIRTPEKSITTIPCDVVSEMSVAESTYIYHRLPAFRAFDLEGEIKKGLAFLSDEVADFAYGENWSLRRRFDIPMNIDDKWEASARMTDINGNGFPDLVVTQTQGTINMKAITQVYLATAPFEYPSKPDAVFEASGGLAAPTFIDVDGDGQRDLILIHVPLGVRNIINFFTRRKVTIRLEVYFFRDGGFTSKPAFTETFTLDAPDGNERVAYSISDFTGDGRVDVAFAAARDRLVIHAGSADRFISSRPWMSFDMPAFGVARPFDLNNNDAMDLVMFYPSGEHRKRVQVIMF